MRARCPSVVVYSGAREGGGARGNSDSGNAGGMVAGDVTREFAIGISRVAAIRSNFERRLEKRPREKHWSKSSSTPLYRIRRHNIASNTLEHWKRVKIITAPKISIRITWYNTWAAQKRKQFMQILYNFSRNIYL